MAGIELPRDAEGREVPLGTTRLFGAGGDAHNITRWVYTTGFDTGDGAAGRWRAATDTFTRLDPGLMYLTPPDSWERLEGDLAAFDGGRVYGPCHYFHEPGGDCMHCPAGGGGPCADAAMRDAASRIRRLRGAGRGVAGR